MKKLALLLYLMSGAFLYAQIDTLHLGQRDPAFYYWDTNWWDHWYFNHPPYSPGTGGDWQYDHNRFMMGMLTRSFYCCKIEYARYCNTNTPLKIIGIAATVGTRIWPDTGILTPRDTSYLPEYFRLYETDSGGRMTLMAETRFDTAHVRKAMCVEMWGYNMHDNTGKPVVEWIPLYGPVYEAYFK